jgi:putative transposase
MKPSTSNVQKVKEFPSPTCKRELQVAMGMLNYYRRFIPQFSQKAHVLNAMLCKDKRFDWQAQHQTAFETLKDTLLKEAVLAYPRYDYPFILSTDACITGIGAVLSQEIDGLERPIAFYSRSLRNYEKKYFASEIEGLSIVESIKHFEVYLHGKPFTLLTDHAALQQIFSKKNSSPRLTRWALSLQHMDMVIKYKRGSLHGNADSLSRMPMPETVSDTRPTINLLTRALPNLGAVQKEQNKDSWMSAMIQYLGNGTFIEHQLENIVKSVKRVAENFSVQYDRLYFTPGGQIKRLVIPNMFTSAFIQEYHTQIWGGHMCHTKTLSRLERFYYWRGMSSQVAKFCKECAICQLHKEPTQATKVPLKPWPAVHKPLDRIGVDIFGSLHETSRHNRVILVVVDYLTRFV